MVTLRPDIDDAGIDRVVAVPRASTGITVEKAYRAEPGRCRCAVLRPACSRRSPSKLARYFGESGDQFRARAGAIYVPDEIAGDVTAVLGLDDRNIARPGTRSRRAPAAAQP